jgi:hypothetical protein
VVTIQKGLSVLIPVVLIVTAAVGWRLMAAASDGSLGVIAVEGVDFLTESGG